MIYILFLFIFSLLLYTRITYYVINSTCLMLKRNKRILICSWTYVLLECCFCRK